MTVPDSTRQSLIIAAAAAADKLAENISAVDVAERIGITDAFLFASAESDRQVKSVVEAIEDALRDHEDLKPIRREGVDAGRWVLLDFGHFVVHVQHEEERALYALDRLWNDSPRIELNLPESGTEGNTA
ncbi:ribosome silencing factor [Citricoccus muralis]|uniref:Ribosomal silencing factor RsfS n=1 Tax=Citricoccus muralis TaxID=169134 RepID=A0ABY8H267_9MICC|nr:ribosome silencing factor [Citricoccus muralis]WFP15219.1 ribosome silencing factor [Citricoccus muralis]